MSNFLPLVEKSYEFEGDTVAVSFRRLKRGQMIKLSPFIPGMVDDGKGGQEPESQTPEQQIKLVDKTVDCLRDNIDTFTGLRNMDGGEITFTEAADEAYFMTLIAEVSMDLISESMVKEKKSSNSPSPSTK